MIMESNQKKDELIITRTFKASRELVWKEWTDPNRLKHWWGPKEFTTPISEIDFRIGGTYLNCMRSPEGNNYWSTGTYLEIVKLERIVFSDSFADEDGNVVPASHYGMVGDWPLELKVTLDFEEHQGITKMTLSHFGIPHGIMRDMTEAGWNESFDKLDAALERVTPNTIKRDYPTMFSFPSDREVVMTRIYNAPRELVFMMMTDPKLVPQWWGPKSLTTTVDEMDVRPGGQWRNIQRGPDGTIYSFNGVYREVVPPGRLIYTFVYEAMPDSVMLETVILENIDGRTKVIITDLFQTVEERDGALKHGMEKGAAESSDRFAELIEKNDYTQ
jgi:uncharacterized protein YndB with AHSA1/START domain